MTDDCVGFLPSSFISYTVVRLLRQVLAQDSGPEFLNPCTHSRRSRFNR